MKKKSPFHSFFDQPQRLSSGEIALCAECFCQVDAVRMISKEVIQKLTYDQIHMEHVRFRFPDYTCHWEISGPAWFLGADSSIPGAKPVWVFDPNDSVNPYQQLPPAPARLRDDGE